MLCSRYDGNAVTATGSIGAAVLLAVAHMLLLSLFLLLGADVSALFFFLSTFAHASRCSRMDVELPPGVALGVESPSKDDQQVSASMFVKQQK